MLLAVPSSAAAAGAGLDGRQREYRQALVGALEILHVAGISPATRAANADSLLRQGAPGEVEAIQALESRPALVTVAESRLNRAMTALDRAANDPDPAASQARLRQILAESRYHPDQGPLAFVRNLLTRFLQWLTQPGAALVKWILVLLVLGLLLLAVVLAVPALRAPLVRRRRPQGTRGATEDGTLPQYFREAESLAALGDHAAAVRALAAGTMELISGTRSYSASPLTVRETFSRSGAAHGLRPLLLAFERSYYGHHQTSREDYEGAAAAARGFRDLHVATPVAA